MRQNFLLGTSETNSLMTYYEKTIQNFITAEDTARAAFSDASSSSGVDIKGTIQTIVSNPRYFRRIWNGTAIEYVDSGTPPDTKNKAPWLRLCLLWSITLPSAGTTRAA